MSGTRNAYDSLTRLAEDFEKDLNALLVLVAFATPVLVMDNLKPHFAQFRDDLRQNAKELRADLDALHVEMTDV